MNQEETAKVAAPSKKEVRKDIVEKLNGALADYKKELGEKKLANRVRQVSKLISRDLKKSSKRQESRTKKTAPKKANQKTAKK